YSSNKIVDIILVLGEAGRNYCRAERLYHNRYPFRQHPNAMQITNPHISTRELQRNLGIPYYITVRRILQRHKFHPYHITLTQDVSENDMRLRRQFCRWTLRMIKEDPIFFQYVFFSDKT
ncbi:hypothetical protein ALC57_01102, partial [Trachymyrmex cornetzi]